MRTERRQEILAQMEQDEKEARQLRFFKFTRVLSIIYIVFAVVLLTMVYLLDMIPVKYLVMGAILMALGSLFIVPVLYSYNGKKGRKIAAMVAAVLLIAAFGVGVYYINTTMNFLDEITNNEPEEITEDYFVLVKAADTPSQEELDAFYQENGKDADPAVLGYRFMSEADLSGMTVGSFLTQDFRYSEAKAELQNVVNVEYAYADDAKTMLARLTDAEGTYAASGTAFDAVLMSQALYESGKLSDWPDIAETTRILYTVKLPQETAVTIDKVDVSKESYNIYISGTDEDGFRSDVNMIATVNPVTNSLLITSIPRDYYVYLPSKASNDKLTHSSIYGVNETVAAVEQTLGLNINYYIRVNYSALKAVVDAIGGVDVESDYTFTTSGMQELNGHYFVKGMNHLDGNAALAFSRERHSFGNGDMQRNINQQKVLEAILTKMTSSTTILSSYTSLLSAVGENMATDMSADEMSAMVKTQLNTMPAWDIQRQAITGEPGYDYCYALGMKASIVAQNPEDDAKALDEIVKVFTASTDSTVNAENNASEQ